MRGSFIAAENKKRATKEAIRAFIELGEKDVGKLSDRDKFLAGVALYFAEGDKTVGGNVAFSNTDARLIIFMMCWL